MLSLLFYIAVRPQDDPEARFEKFIRSATSLRVDMRMKVSGVSDIGKGYFMAKRPDHVLWVMKWGKSDFSFSSAGNEIVAIEKSNRLYRQYGAVGRLFVPESDISSTPEYGFPLALLSGSLLPLVPDGMRFTSAGKTTINGVSADVIKAAFATPNGRVTVTASIDAKGKLMECTTAYGEGPTQETRALTFTNYAVNKHLSDALFKTSVPKGFISQTLPGDAYPINVGEKMPLEGWKPVSGSGDLKALSQNKVLFIAIGDPHCEVSVRAARTVANLAREVEAKGGAAVAICPTSSSPQPVYSSLSNFYDPTGKVFDRLRTPGTPTFFLVSPRGIVTRVWYGFDTGQAAEFVKDALEWVDSKKGG